jgi:CCR4-NOT complex subunit CAF16
MQPVIVAKDLNYCYGKSVLQSQGDGKPQLENINCQFARGSRVLVAGANGSGKSTFLSIVGGKRMIPRTQCRIFGKDVFHDSDLNSQVMYCGDWWRTDFFCNISVVELLGSKFEEPRCQRLMEILQVEPDWRINSISDGQRRRCQLLECLSTEKSVYIMDEITTDLDLYAREGLLRFLQHETEERGATILYATHIFDSLADWATHVVFVSGGKMVKCCSMQDLQEYHDLIAGGEKVPLYGLMKRWVFKDYPEVDQLCNVPLGEQAKDVNGAIVDVKALNYSYAAGLPPVLKDITFGIERGTRVLVTGANGASKTTLLSILGGKRMIPRGFAKLLQLDAFNDTGLGRDVMFMGDWWRTKFFMNMAFKELIAPELRDTARCKHLEKVLQVDMNWLINDCSDGMRRRCQLLEALVQPKSVYLMDEITSDLDIYAREGLLNFLRAESEIRGATIMYCTHIYDHLEGWPTHFLYMSQGELVTLSSMDQLAEYQELLNDPSVNCPLYSMIRKRVYAEYEKAISAPKKQKLMDDGRIPNLGLAGPFMTVCG